MIVVCWLMYQKYEKSKNGDVPPDNASHLEYFLRIFALKMIYD